jgi:glucosamine-6-phosphate deaminase
MKVIITENYDEMSRKAGEIVTEIVKNNPNAILGLATGSSPIGMYDYMVKEHLSSGVSYAKVSSVNLDEYVGLDGANENSYAFFMSKYLFDRVNIDKKNTYLPNGKAEDKQVECDRYNALLETMKQDVQVLGIGSNGHIGFNEPGTSLDSVTHVVDLTENTIKDNSRLFDDISQVPTQAFSMGIKNIMNAKSIILLASGKNKAEAIRGLVKGKIDVSLPASVLQLHPFVTVIVDKDAASLL